MDGEDAITIILSLCDQIHIYKTLNNEYRKQLEESTQPRGTADQVTSPRGNPTKKDYTQNPKKKRLLLNMNSKV